MPEVRTLPCAGVLGMGSVLMQDDGFGPYALQMLLARHTFPQGVRVEDLGTPGLHLAPLMEDLDSVIIIDTVKGDREPGTVQTYRRDQLMKLPAGPRASPHDPGLHETLLTLDMAGRCPTEFL
ncbi:MAG: hydrogenase maturation protease, partial [Acidimicrobiia bacterium]|nr:hydrogenase maturation protease [Acidimicrobiia bacterium]